MIKKRLFLIGLLLSILFSPTVLFAQQKTLQNPDASVGNSSSSVKPQMYPVPPNYQDNRSILGQDHAYSVTFRGNGEAVVSAKVVFTNLTDSPVSSMSLRVPKVDPKDVIVFQVLRERTCIDGYRQLSPDAKPGVPLVCSSYQEPNFYDYYGNSKYQKATNELHGDTIDITLPQPVKANSSGAFLVYYRAFGYAKKNLFGAYNFTFETLKVEDKIRDLTVGISTDSDLVLKDAKGKVNYRFESGMMALKSADAMPMTSPQFDQYYQQIGNGTVTKKASSLQPLDSYSVKGAYAENSFRLYGKEISIALLVFLVCIAVLFFIAKKSFAWLSANRKQEIPTKSMGISILTTTGLGFVTSLFILFYTGGLIVVIMILRQLFGYDEFLFIFNALLVIISIAIYVLLIFVPSIVVGVKKGVLWGLGTFIATVVWLVVDMIFAFIIIFFAFRFQNRPYPIPFLENMMGTDMMRANIEKSSGTIQVAPQPIDSSTGTEQVVQ